MWFKQNEQKSPQQPEIPAPRQQQPVAPIAPAAPVDVAPVFAPPVAAAPMPAGTASRITPGLTLKGEISGREDLWIGGSVDGKLHFDSARVAVGSSGKMHGEIEAREIVIEGKTEGNLRATERLEITATGTVRGDASAPRVALQEGAVFNGAIEVLRPGESRSSVSAAPASSRTTVAPRNPRPQAVQAASAAASAGATSSTAAVTESSEESAAATAPALRRGIAAEPAESSD